MHTQQKKPGLASLLPRSEVKTGAIYYTPGIRENVTLDTIVECLARHVAGDWGDLSDDDKQRNDQAYKNDDGRLLSSYNLKNPLPGGPEKIWVITEADRSYTTILLPEEY